MSSGSTALGAFGLTLLVLLLIPSLAAAQNHVYVYPGDEVVTGGADFPVEVRLNATDEVYAAEMVLDFDPDVLQVKGYSEGDFFNDDGASTSFPIGVALDNANGKFYFANTRLNPAVDGVTGDRGLFTLEFEQLNIWGPTWLNLSELNLSDPNGVYISYSTQKGLRTLVPVEGDVDGNCVVNIFDLARVGMAYNTNPGETYWNPNADINKDGEISILDLAAVGYNFRRTCCDGNAPPEMDAGGPYVVEAGEPLALDASGSIDPNEYGCGDDIVFFEWDLDDDGYFDDLETTEPKATLNWSEVESHICGGSCVPDHPYGISVQGTDRWNWTNSSKAYVFIITTCTPTPETCDGLDNDCDGEIDEDFPTLDDVCSAGIGACQAGGHVVCMPDGSGVECDAVPGTPEPELCDGLDNDCDGDVDEGNPGGGGSCNTGLPGVCSAGTLTCSDGSLHCTQDVFPSSEICDGLDNDCDGDIDEGNPGGGGSCNTGLPGVCSSGTTTCSSGSLTCVQDTLPSSEACNGLDDDCDGSVDESLIRSCYTGPGGTLDVGVCQGGLQTCSAGTWDSCEGEVVPSMELCDGSDNDCDGTTDNNMIPPPCALQLGVCSGSTQTCGGVSGWQACTATNYGSFYEPTELSCDTLDNDCDGLVDEDGVCAVPSCSDGVLNGDETDVDCGGSCTSEGKYCAAGEGCIRNDDCSSWVCTGSICQVPSCSDDTLNGDETDVDCGGSCTSEGKYCAAGEGCIINDDCSTWICIGSICQDHACGDGLCTGPETAESCPIDCPSVCGDGYCTHDEWSETCPEDCGDYYCFGIAYNDPDVCSGHGTCTSTEMCVCDTGYSGSDCSLGRFLDHDDGTVEDLDTGLFWLKNATCLGLIDADIYNSDPDSITAFVEDGQCGLADGSISGNWRIPSDEEWTDFLDTTYEQPPLCNTNGTGQWTEGDAFTDIVISEFPYGASPGRATNMVSGLIFNYVCQAGLEGLPCHFLYIWPVRDTMACHGIPHDDPSVCSGHGLCVEPDICVCDAGYSGADCSSGPIETDAYSFSAMTLMLETPGGPLGADLTGPSTIEARIDPSTGEIPGDPDPDSDTMDQIETEIVSMDLIGNSPGLGDTEVMLSLVAPSAGETEETANNNAGYLDLPPFYPGTAESFFDVFVKVILYDQGEIVLHNVDPVRIVATVSEKPVAADETYASTGSPVMLYDDDSKPTPMSISSMSYTPDKSLFCYGIPHDDPSVCSGNGMCIDTDTCICEAGWTGDECSTLI